VVIAAKPPQPIEKGLPGPGLLAQTVLSKYGDYLPLYRQEDILSRNGILQGPCADDQTPGTLPI